jgi:hypothetical protein
MKDLLARRESTVLSFPSQRVLPGDNSAGRRSLALSAASLRAPVRIVLALKYFTALTAILIRLPISDTFRMSSTTKFTVWEAQLRVISSGNHFSTIGQAPFMLLALSVVTAITALSLPSPSIVLFKPRAIISLVCRSLLVTSVFQKIAC